MACKGEVYRAFPLNKNDYDKSSPPHHTSGSFYFNLPMWRYFSWSIFQPRNNKPKNKTKQYSLSNIVKTDEWNKPGSLINPWTSEEALGLLFSKFFVIVGNCLSSLAIIIQVVYYKELEPF